MAIISKKACRNIAFCALAVIVVVMAVATFVEKSRGTQFVSDAVYGSWWFVCLWAAIAVFGLAYFFSGRRPFYNTLLHSSLVLILVGALLTLITARHGMIHLRQGVAVDSIVLESGSEVRLPFALQLDRFDVDYHAGTSAPSDYSSCFTVIDPAHGETVQGSVSMNRTFSYGGVRFFQTSYDDDMLGSHLTVNEDRIGMSVTYVGYGLLFVALVWMLLAPGGGFRRLLRNPRLKRGLSVVALLLVASGASAVESLSQPAAKAFGEMLIQQNGRICPVQTVAIDFTKKLSGKSSYNGYSAEQVMTGYLFYGEAWSKEPLIRVKSSALRQATGLPKQASLADFFRNGYVLGKYVEAYYQGNRNGLNKAAADMDDRIALVMSLRQGGWLKMFPVKDGSSVVWCSPVDNLPASTDSIQALFIRNAFRLLNDMGVQPGNDGAFIETVDQMKNYQLKYGGESVPSASRIKAERVYNQLPFADWLYRLDLPVGLLLVLLFVRSLLRSRPENSSLKGGVRKTGLGVLIASFVVLTAGLVLRYIVSHRLPLGNGYETMLALAWCIQLVTLVIYRRMPYMLPFGLLLSGFFLLVSAISRMDPQITPLMPVLSSPLLSVHVSLIMMAYALLSFTFVCSLIAIIISAVKGGGDLMVKDRVETLQLVSKMFLYPALALLAMGIFVGAIWANQSWGRYWGWDPKETWALINLLVYAVAVHGGSLPWMRRPMAYHVYVGLAFLTVLMTYVGVNYFLGGMHSYA